MDGEPRDFESAVTELEGLVKKLEQGDLPLEQALVLFERGVALSRYCHTRLDEAERRIQVLTDRGELKAAPPDLDALDEDGPDESR